MDYDGSWGGMDIDFKEGLEIVIDYLLKPERLVLKKINSKELNGNEVLEYIQGYLKLFQSDQLPKAQSIYESTVEKQLSIIVENCFNTYKKVIFKSKDILTNRDQIPMAHGNAKAHAILLYRDEKKMGSFEHEQKFRNILEQKIESLFEDWKSETEVCIARIKAEEEKTLKLIEEKQKLYEAQLESEKQAYENLIRISNEMKNEQEAEIARLRLLHEQERTKRMEEEEEKDEAVRLRIAAENKFLAKESEGCTIL